MVSRPAGCLSRNQTLRLEFKSQRFFLHERLGRSRLLAGRRFAFAQARAAHHFILRRVVAILAFDSGAHPFDGVPDDRVEVVALIAQVGQLGLQGIHLRLDGTGLCEIGSEAIDGDISKGGLLIDLLPGGEPAWAWASVSFGNVLPIMRVPPEKMFCPGDVPQSYA